MKTCMKYVLVGVGSLVIGGVFRMADIQGKP